MKRIMTAVFLVLLVPLAACAGFFGGSGVHTHQSSASGGSVINNAAATRGYTSCTSPLAGFTGPGVVCTAPAVPVNVGDLIIVQLVSTVAGAPAGTQTVWVNDANGVAVSVVAAGLPCEIQVFLADGEGARFSSYCEFKAAVSGTAAFQLNAGNGTTVSAGETTYAGVRVLRGGAP